MTNRRTFTPLRQPDLFTEYMRVAGFMFRWFEREQLLTLQAMGFSVSPSKQPCRTATKPDLRLQSTPLPRRVAPSRATTTTHPAHPVHPTHANHPIWKRARHESSDLR